MQKLYITSIYIYLNLMYKSLKSNNFILLYHSIKTLYKNINLTSVFDLLHIFTNACLVLFLFVTQSKLFVYFINRTEYLSIVLILVMELLSFKWYWPIAYIMTKNPLWKTGGNGCLPITLSWPILLLPHLCMACAAGIAYSSNGYQQDHNHSNHTAVRLTI